MSWRSYLLNRVTITFGLLLAVGLGWNVYVTLNNDGILKGQVVGPAGDPVAGAKVTLYEQQIVGQQPVETATTDAEGRFHFEHHNQHHPILQAAKEGVGKTGRIGIRLYFRNQNRELAQPLRLAPSD